MGRGIRGRGRCDRGTLRTYALSHNVGGEIEGLLMAYKEVLNGMLADIWSAIEWRTRPVKGKRQARRIPYLRIDRQLNAAVNIYMRMEGVPRATRPPACHPSGAARRSFHPPGDDVSRCAPAPRTFRANRFIRVSGNPH
ncbi:MAG: hypothetical protein ACP5UD_03185 [Conexivisphaera sp.]